MKLSDPTFYPETQEDLNHQHTLDINFFLKTMSESKVINDKFYEYLYVSKERTCLFYLLPIYTKVKNQQNQVGILYLETGCLTERISQFVDFFPQHTVRLLPSYVQDTSHFLSKVENLKNIPPESIILTMDVSQLYTNIPNQKGIEASKFALRNGGQYGC